MNYPAHSKFPFHRDGNAYRRDADAQPTVLLLASANDPDTEQLAGVVVHFAGDEYSREVPRHSINADLIEGMEPMQAFALGRLTEGGELEGEVYANP